jgi:arsenite methyltransferase
VERVRRGGVLPVSEGMREQVRKRYSEAALKVVSGGGCCGPETGCGVDLTAGGYSPDETAGLPAEAAGASLGCGNPVALAELAPGEVVLDLGSGGGLDVLLSARRVAPGGKAYGLDMTDEMLELARKNRREAGVENAEFLKGEMEDIPLPDGSVDVVISNCVINLSTEKDRALAEAFRVLRPGGRFAVYDMVFPGDGAGLPPEARKRAELWAGCVSGAMSESEYRTKLAAAGFEDVSIEPTRTYSSDGISGGACCGDELAGVSIASAFVRARKPGGE